MAKDAYACRITMENMQVIASEFGPGWSREEAVDWLLKHEEGWFLRDESSVLDKKFFVSEVFFTMYFFVSGDATSLFRRVEQV